MKKLFRVLFSIVILLVIVVAIAIGTLMYFINPNKLKPIIISEVKKHSGYEVAMDGEFTWSFYPRLGIKVGRIQFMMPQQKTAFLNLDRVLFVTELKDLLHGNQKLRGDVYVGEITLMNVHIHDAHVGLNWQNQVLTFAPMVADLYGGHFVSDVQAKNLNATPHFTFNVKMDDVDLQPLLTDLNGADSQLKLAGKGQVELHANASGKSSEQMIASMNGDSKFVVKNGSVEGVDLNYLIKTANAIINKQPATMPTDRVDRTVFDGFSGTAIIRNGVATTNDISLNSAELAANATGNVNLSTQVINMQVRITPKLEVMKAAVMIPVAITGTLQRPDARLETNALSSVIAKQKVDEVKTKVRDEIKRHVPGKTGEILQNLLGK